MDTEYQIYRYSIYIHMGHSKNLPAKTGNRTNFISAKICCVTVPGRTADFCEQYIICFVIFCRECIVRSHGNFLSIIKCVLLSVFGSNFMEWPIYKHTYMHTLINPITTSML